MVRKNMVDINVDQIKLIKNMHEYTQKNVGARQFLLSMKKIVYSATAMY